MSIRDLMPEGFSEEMAYYAQISRKARIYSQRLFGSTYAIWLEIEGGGQTMIGHGDPAAAVAEARVTLNTLAESIHGNLAELMRNRA